MGSSGPSGSAGAANALLAAFFEKRENLVLFVAARTRSMETAEDLVQDLYLKLATMEVDDADVRAPAALLYRMAANLVVDHVRSAQRGGRRDATWRSESHTAIGGEDVSAETPADEAIITRERARRLAEAVEGLPPQMGRAFRSHKLEGRSQADTAQIMGVSRKMVEAHIAAAIKHLVQRLR